MAGVGRCEAKMSYCSGKAGRPNSYSGEVGEVTAILRLRAAGSKCSAIACQRGERSCSDNHNIPVRAPLRSCILVCLILFLMRSFWILRCSAFPHQIGRLYSHFTHRFTQAPQEGCFSSHFFRRRRHVKQPNAGNRCWLEPTRSQVAIETITYQSEIACAT